MRRGIRTLEAMGLLEAIGIEGVYLLVTIMLVALLIVATTDFLKDEPDWQGDSNGGLTFKYMLPPSRLAIPAPPVDRVVQEAEVRQMLEAKAFRQQQRGELPLDVEAEMTRLLDSPHSLSSNLDRKLRAEVRELVLARNERRMCRGQEPLDIEAEIERQCADFTGLGK